MIEPTAPAAHPAPRLRLRVKAAAETILRSGHPWLFAESIREQNRPGQFGELAVIYDRRDRFLAVGLFDPNSPLRVRVLHTGKPQTVNREWWRRRLLSALNRRKTLFDHQTTGYRWINGESDGWPGLVLDRYDSTLVLKLYTAVWLPRLAEITSLLQDALPNDRVVLRLSRNIQKVALSEFQCLDGHVLRGTEPQRPLTFLETGLRFEADVLRGQKTGFFLDQRENRRHVELMARGSEVLNAFSFSGGFSLYAARGGAELVIDLDISAHALASAQRNFALNQANPAVSGCRHETVQADAFAWLAQNTARKFDLVILDPPSLAKRETERATALQAYRKLIKLGSGHLRRGGILVASSCSAHVSAPEFFTAVQQTARTTGRKFEAMQTTGHPPDHPATFPEAHYLKCIYLQFQT